MAVMDKLLKYQQEDSKLLKIEKEMAASDERKNLAQATAFLNKASDRLDALEAKAKELAVILTRLNEKYDEISEVLKDFEHIDELIDGGADISFYKKNVLQLTDRLKAVKGEAAQLSKSMKEADEEYQNLKKKVLAVQKQHAEYSETYKKYKEDKQTEVLAIKRELDKLKAGIDPEIMKKYDTKRGERIFPVLCPVKNGRCGICGTELSIASKDRVASGNTVECDNCRRVLYKELGG